MTVSVRVVSFCTICGESIREPDRGPFPSLDEMLERINDPDRSALPLWVHSDPALDEDHTAVPPDGVEPW